MISIIVPVYNAAPYLTDCIESLIGQITTEPLEIILVDDSSTDNSLAIAQPYAKKHAEDPLRKVVLLTQQHSGQSIARNLGLQNANGEYIAFVDADDRIAPDWCARHLKAIKKVDYVQSGYRRTSEGQTATGWHVGIRRIPRHQYSNTSPCMRLYRRSALKDIRFEGGMIYEDVVFSTDLWLTNPSYKRIRYAGYLYTKNPEGITAHVHLDAKNRVMDELHNRLPMATWKGKCILWYTILRLRFHFIFEMSKKLDKDFVAPKPAAAMLLLAMMLCFSPLRATNYTATNASTFISQLSNLTAGDTLFLRGGTYEFADKFSINKQGTSAHPVVIAGYSGEEGPHGIMTTKFFEALGCEKPVLCAPSDEECLADVIQQTHAGIAASSVEEVQAFILDNYAAWKAKNFTRQSVNPEQKELFTRQYQAQQFEHLFTQHLLNKTGFYD